MRRLNFGCGKDIRTGWENCDVQKGAGVISFDFNKTPYPIKDSTYDLIETRSVLEMLDNVDDVLYELRRITKNLGRIRIFVPYWHNKGAYNDIQVKHFFNEYSFIYFAEQKPCRIDTVKKFRILKLIKEPTIMGRLFPRFIRDKLDLFFSGIYANLEIELEVIK